MRCVAHQPLPAKIFDSYTPRLVSNPTIRITTFSLLGGDVDRPLVVPPALSKRFVFHTHRPSYITRSNITQTSSSQSLDKSLRIIYWNAGGLNDVKFVQFKWSVFKEDVDIFFLVEAGVATENPDFCQMNDYAVITLRRSRQVASGIYVGIKNILPGKFKILHEMSEEDKLEAVLIEVWKNRQHFSIVNHYNPPGNIPSLNEIERTLQRNNTIIGDLNSPSTR